MCVKRKPLPGVLQSTGAGLSTSLCTGPDTNLACYNATSACSSVRFLCVLLTVSVAAFLTRRACLYHSCLLWSR